MNVICIHGWGLNAAVWSGVSARLSGRHDIRAPDLPGHGANAERLPDRLASLVNWLAEDVPDGSAWLGWSFGGEIALAAATILPHKVGRLLLVSTTPRFVSGPDWPHGVGMGHWEAFAHDLTADYDRTLGRFLALQCGNRDLKAVRSLRQTLLNRGRPRPEALSTALALMADTDLRPQAGEIRARTLVVHGDRDRIIPVAAGRWLGSHLPNARLMVVPDAGHAPFITHEATFCAAV
ncbi:MAG: alpha/beta fold hydrolase, partial [Acidiferrobacteraceae bacterium]